MAEAKAGSVPASAFNPAKEFPNIVWNFDSLADPKDAAVAEDVAPVPELELGVSDEGLITAPPTPPTAAPVVDAPSQSSLPKPVSPTVSKSTPAKRKSSATQGSSNNKKTKIAVKSKKPTRKDGRERKVDVPAQPPADEKSRVERLIAKNQARKALKRERRKQKREAARSKASDSAKAAAKSDVGEEGEAKLPVSKDQA